MEDHRGQQQRSPDSSTALANGNDKISMTNNNHITEHGACGVDSGRATNLAAAVGYKCPKGCKTIFVDEHIFAGHLLSEHNVRLVVTSSQAQHLNGTNQKTTMTHHQTPTSQSSPSSSSSPSTTPPAANIVTKCPVCRLQVDDLSYHFATAHSTTKPTNHDR